MTVKAEKAAPIESERLRMERDFLLRLLELGQSDDVRPFLHDALALIAGATGAKKGYVALHSPSGDEEPRFWFAHGLGSDEIEGVRREISSGIVAEALATG